MKQRQLTVKHGRPVFSSYMSVYVTQRNMLIATPMCRFNYNYSATNTFPVRQCIDYPWYVAEGDINVRRAAEKFWTQICVFNIIPFDVHIFLPTVLECLDPTGVEGFILMVYACTLFAKCLSSIIVRPRTFQKLLAVLETMNRRPLILTLRNWPFTVASNLCFW